MTLVAVLARIAELSPAPASAPTPRPASSASFTDVLAQTTGKSSAASFAADFETAGQRSNVDPQLLEAVAAQESGFDPTATSSAGAEGLMQLMPATAASLGVTNPYDPAQSIDGGARTLRADLDRFGGSVPLALAAYNAGAGAVDAYGGVPPYAETQNYVAGVLARYASLENGGSQA